MEGISEIKDYNSLRAAFLKLDTSYDGKIDKKESEEDVNKYDKDKNDSVELWEYMEAVNREVKNQIFKNYEIEANKKAYELFKSLLEESSLQPKCPGYDHGNYKVPLLEFLQKAIELGIEKARILKLADRLFSNSCFLLKEEYLREFISLLRIGATDEEVLEILPEGGKFPNLIDELYELGFEKKEILNYSKYAVRVAMRSFPYLLFPKEEEFFEPARELKLLGFKSREIVNLATQTDSLDDRKVDIIRGLIVAGMPKTDILKCVSSVKQTLDNLPKAYEILMTNKFPKEMALKLLLDLDKKENLSILLDYPEIISPLLRFFKNNKHQLIEYLINLPKEIGHSASFLQLMLNNGWDINSINNILDFISDTSKKLSGDEKKYLSDQVIAAVKEVEAYKTEKNFWVVLDNIAENIRISGTQNLKETFYLAHFTFALYVGYEDFLWYPQSILKDYIMSLQTQNTKLKLLKTLPEKFKPSLKFGKILSKIISVNGITIIAADENNYDPVIIPGSVTLGQNEIGVNRFNRKNFKAVFEVCPEAKMANIKASDALYEASNILPEEFFHSFDRKERLRIEFRQIKEGREANRGGSYPPNVVNINTIFKDYLSVIVHELGHHWDLNLTVGFSGEQNTTGDLSLLYHKISWTPEKIEREIDGWDFGKVPMDRHDFDKDDFVDEYSMCNRKEDFACFMEQYVLKGQSLRATIREQIRKGNFELATKYLFVKYLANFQGKDYDLIGGEKGITFGEVEQAKESVPDKSCTNSETFSIIEEIKQKARDKKLIP